MPSIRGLWPAGPPLAWPGARGRPGAPILGNRYAARLLEQRDGLTIEQSALIAAAPAAARQLTSALGAAIAVSKGTAISMPNGELVIPRSARRPLLVSISPVGRLNPYGELASGAAASLLVVDPNEVALPPGDRLRELFSLTAAEARVAAGLAAGRQAAELADELGVTQATVRSQVKRILDKSATRSQSSFIRLVTTESMRFGSPAEK